MVSELGTMPASWAAVAISVLITLDVLSLGVGIVNARRVGHDPAARSAAGAAHRRLDDLLGLDHETSLDEIVDDYGRWENEDADNPGAD